MCYKRLDLIFRPLLYVEVSMALKPPTPLLAALWLLLCLGCNDASRDGGGACADECALGQAQCGALSELPALQVCEASDAGCLRYTEPRPCRPGLVCADGACVEGERCPSGCAIGASRCTWGNLVEACLDRDGDGCGEFGDATPCPDGAVCAQGACVPSTPPQCEDECAVEGRSCGGGELIAECADGDGDGCLELITSACGAGEICAQGACRVACQGACATGARHCVGDTPERCADPDGDGCPQWIAEAPCGADQRCDGGQCVDQSIPCSDECSAGASRCPRDDQEQGCGDHDDDDCLEWGDPRPCAANALCSDERCEVVCHDDCAFDDARCGPTGLPEYCWDSDPDPCLDWTPRAPCAGGEACQGGACEPTCAQECPARGERRCRGDTVEICGDFDADLCLEWGVDRACGAGTACVAGACVCVDECASGARCNVLGELESCADHDGDGCDEWGGATACPADHVCADSACQPVGCQGECAPGTRCDAFGDLESCEDHDGDGCAEWGGAIACPADHVCVDGACQFTGCEDECPSFGAYSCGSGGRRLSCADFDEDGCLEWGGLHNCPLWNQACVDGDCAFTCSGVEPCQGEVLITEIQFDPSAATDALGEYIEVYNASGRALNLSGCTINDDSTSHTFGDFPLAVGQYAVIGRTDVAADNGGLDVDYVIPDRSVGLRNSYEETLELHCARLISAFDFGYWVAGGAGVSAQLHGDRRSEIHRRKSFNWCDSVEVYGAGDRGTPGAANAPCYGRVLYEDDLEISALENPHWSFGDSETRWCNWEWGEPRDQGFYNSPRCTQEGGLRCLGTDMDLWHWDLMDYSTNWVQLELDLSSLDLLSPLELRLDLYFGIHEDEEDDHGQVTISIDGLNFEPLYFYTHPYTHPEGAEVQWSDSIFWGDAAADLSSYSGHPSVLIRFQMETDNGLLGPGFYIDNVRVLVP